MEWNKDNLEGIVSFINQELSKGRPMIKIELEEFGENERVIHKRLIRLGYKKVDNQYVFNGDITSKLTPTKKDVISNNTNNTTSNITVENLDITKLDIDKLNLLLTNIDKILNLIPTDNTSNITQRSGTNEVRSLRIDTGLYKAVKERALRDSINISDIVNKSLDDYLNNYL